MYYKGDEMDAGDGFVNVRKGDSNETDAGFVLI